MLVHFWTKHSLHVEFISEKENEVNRLVFENLRNAITVWINGLCDLLASQAVRYSVVTSHVPPRTQLWHFALNYLLCFVYNCDCKIVAHFQVTSKCTTRQINFVFYCSMSTTLNILQPVRVIRQSQSLMTKPVPIKSFFNLSWTLLENKIFRIKHHKQVHLKKTPPFPISITF